MKYGDLTYEEIRDRARQDWLAIIPTGCTEQQGPHLPVDNDTWFVERVCNAASSKADADYGVQSLVLPTIPFGPTPEHRNYGAGYIDIPVELHDSLVLSTLESLTAQGFRKIVVWRGCGGHDLRETVKRFNETYNEQSRAFLPGHPYHEVWRRIADLSVPGGHADSFTTSIMLHLRPEAVRKDRIVDPEHEPVDWEDPDLDFANYSSTGVIGDPTHASAELGAKLWDAVVDEVAATLRSIASCPETVPSVDVDKLHFLRRSKA
ncbi:MAG: creatininase family protein [Chloroflexi bacterium]|nr:creatininase family protein [Chloroflexota bacterium]